MVGAVPRWRPLACAALISAVAGASAWEGAGLRRASAPPPPRPTKQPATRGQDDQTCGWLSLPDDIFLSPKISDKFTKSGSFENRDGATYSAWTQDLFAWDYQTVYFQVDSKLFVKAEVIENEEVQLPGIVLKKERHGPPVSTVVLRDCNNVVMYILREAKGSAHSYNISNRDDVLIASSIQGTYFKDQMQFFDDEGKPIVLAQSPNLIEDRPEGAPGDHGEEYFGRIAPWEVKFIDGYNSSSSLIIPQNRWVIAIAVQVRAIRDAERGGDGAVTAPEVFPFFMALVVVGIMVVLALFFCFFLWVYRLVYPKRYDEIENKYLQDQRRMYGSFKYKEQGSRAIEY